MSNTLLDAERAYADRLARELPHQIDLNDLPNWIGIGRTTIFRLRRRGKFPIKETRVGGTVKFAGIDVLRYLLRENH